MVFPAEAEPRAKRRALSLCQDQLRTVIDITRKTTQIIEAFAKNDRTSVPQLFEEVQKISDEVDTSKRAIAQELVEIGAILLSREDFLRFIDVISEIADLCKGVSFRLLELMEHKWDVPQELRKDVSELAAAVFDTISKLREEVFTLNYGSPKISERARDVEIAERNVDNLHRKLAISILESNMKISSTLLVRDIVQLLEDIADKVEDASDAARIVAFIL